MTIPMMTTAIMITDGVVAAALLVGIVSLFVNWRRGRSRARAAREMLDLYESLQKSLREEMERSQRQCLSEIAEIRETIEEAEKNAQANLELLRDGRVGMPARAQALRLLRSGMSAETAAADLGLSRNEVRLLEKVSTVMASRN